MEKKLKTNLVHPGNTTTTRHYRVSVCFLVATLCWGLHLCASAQGLEIQAPLMRKCPTIDGAISEEEWSDAVRGVGLVDANGELVSRQAAWWLGTDGKMIYVALRSETPPQGAILARVNPDQRDNVAVLQLDDVLELWLFPEFADGIKAVGCQFMGNPLGCIYDVKFDPSQSTPFLPWDGAWKFCNRVKDGWWESELAIPIEEFTPKGSRAVLKSLAFRLTRNWMQPSQNSSTESWGAGGYANVASMSRYIIEETAPRIQVLSLGDWMKADLDVQMAVSNPGRTEKKVKVRLDVASTSTQAPFSREETLVISAGERKEVKFKNSIMKGVECTVTLRVGTPTDDQVWFLRQWKLKTAKPETIWTTVQQEKKAVELLFAYSPYQNKIRAKVDFSGMRNAAEVRKVMLSVWPKEGKHPLSETAATQFKDQTMETTWEIPDLPDGAYELRCSLEGKDVLKDAVVKPFERKHFEWEHNTLGISDQVVEPFLPLEVKGQSVKAIFREYQMNPFGLCAQILSENQSLLAGPMELQAVVGDQPVTWKARKLKFTEKKGARVAIESQWQGSGIHGQTRTCFDYDGLMSLELKIQGDVSVKSLDLVVPLQGKEIPLMHTVGAGIRSNHAGKIPEGEGEIWNNTQAATYGVPHQFLPYVWVGGTRRGLAWYADSDQGWVPSKEQPEISMVRKGNIVSLVFHLITRPVDLKQPRTIKFAFQATPVKPRPADWRNWCFAGKYQVKPKPGETTDAPPFSTRYMSIWGSGGYWGSVSAYGDVYPRDRDFSLLEKFAEVKRRGKVEEADRAFIEKWIEGYREKDTTKSYYANHVRCGLGYATVPIAIPYTNARGARETQPEFRVFQDEWGMMPFTTREWSDKDMTEVQLEPVASHQDFALWYYRKMMEIGFADGIYWDNTMPLANRNPFAPGVYQETQGTICPGVGITSMRNLIKRAAVLYRSQGKEPCHIAHMSNGAVVPMLAFCAISMDWEMKYGSDDFQDRFREDFIFTETMGEQSGCVPLVIVGIQPTKEKTSAWLTRTLIATTSIYELKIWPAYGVDHALLGKILEIIYGFGYGQPDCQVYRCWENPPFQSNRPDARCILYARDGKLILITSDFGAGGPCRIRLDTGKLNLGKSWTARNAETGKEVGRDGTDTVVFELAKHDFNIITIEPQ